MVLGNLAKRVARFGGLRVREVLADAVDGENRQDADDRDDDHQLDQRKPWFGRTDNRIHRLMTSSPDFLG